MKILPLGVDCGFYINIDKPVISIIHQYF